MGSCCLLCRHTCEEKESVPCIPVSLVPAPSLPLIPVPDSFFYLVTLLALLQSPSTGSCVESEENPTSFCSRSEARGEILPLPLAAMHTLIISWAKFNLN